MSHSQDEPDGQIWDLAERMVARFKESHPVKTDSHMAVFFMDKSRFDQLKDTGKMVERPEGFYIDGIPVHCSAWPILNEFKIQMIRRKPEEFRESWE
jgi:hypothetical protein